MESSVILDHSICNNSPHPYNNTKDQECELCSKCLNSGDDEQLTILTDDVISLVFRTMLIPKGENKADYNNYRSLSLCSQCAESFTTFSDICHHLETLRCEFNKLRRELGTRVISNTLKHKRLSVWEEEITTVEHVFPSCIKLETEESTSSQLEFEIGEKTIELTTEEDLKLTKMKPVVMLERLTPSLIKFNGDSLHSKHGVLNGPIPYENMETQDDDDDCPTPTLRMLLLTLPGPKRILPPPKPSTSKTNHIAKKKDNTAETIRKIRKLLKPPTHFKQQDFKLEEFLLEVSNTRKMSSNDEHEKPTCLNGQLTSSKRRMFIIKNAISFNRQCQKIIKTKQPRPFKCKQCNKSYNRSDHVTRHIRRTHENQVKEYECQHCDKKFVYAHNLFRHVQTSHRPLKTSIKNRVKTRSQKS